jgi:F-type H+-transporting ATPase subunit delta
MASELAAVRDLIAGSQDLHRVLVDSGVPAASRRALVEDLLSSQVGGPTLRLLVFVIAAERAGEVFDSIEWLVSRVQAAAEGRQPAENIVLGHKAAEERLDGYTTALLEVGLDPRMLAEVEDELFRFHRIVGGSEGLRKVLSSRDVTTDARKSLVVDLLTSRSSVTTVSLAGYATHIGRPRDYEDLLAYLVDRVAAESNRRLAEVRSAVELDESQRRDLAAALRRVIGHEVDVRVTVDRSVLAGFVATIGDTVVDGSARHRLDILKERLVMPEANVTTGEPN